MNKMTKFCRVIKSLVALYLKKEKVHDVFPVYLPIQPPNETWQIVNNDFDILKLTIRFMVSGETKIECEKRLIEMEDYIGCWKNKNTEKMVEHLNNSLDV